MVNPDDIDRAIFIDIGIIQGVLRRDGLSKAIVEVPNLSGAVVNSRISRSQTDVAILVNVEDALSLGLIIGLDRDDVAILVERQAVALGAVSDEIILQLSAIDDSAVEVDLLSNKQGNCLAIAEELQSILSSGSIPFSNTLVQDRDSVLDGVITVNSSMYGMVLV